MDREVQGGADSFRSVFAIFDPMLTYCQMEPMVHTSEKLDLNAKWFLELPNNLMFMLISTNFQ